MKNIVFIGMMGCGKTTIAKLLSQKLQRPYIDIDEYIVEKYHMSIAQMFDISESYFRERETICCREIGKKQGIIISTGGGIIKNQINVDLLKENGFIIYIDRPIDMICQDVDTSTRPLLKEGTKKLYQLYEERHSLYMNACDCHLMNDSTLKDVVYKILDCIK